MKKINIFIFSILNTSVYDTIIQASRRRITGMKKKLLMFLIGMTMVIGSLSGCGKSNTETTAQTTEAATDASEATNPEDEEPVGMGNPIEEVSPEKIVEVTGSKAILPEGAKNPTYLLISNELGEVRFTLDSAKINMTLRSQKLDEFTDISGMYCEWQSEYGEHIGDYEAKIMNFSSDEEGDIRVYLWYDAENKVMYSLSAQADKLDHFDMYGIIVTMMQATPQYDKEVSGYPSNAMEERTGKTEFSSYDEIISLLEGTEGYALVKIKGYDGDVLLVADNVYDNLDGNMATIEATPYTMKSTGAVSADSLLTSGGTAYPISIGDDGLVYLYGNHSVETQCYGENGTDDAGLMVMKLIYISEFDSNGDIAKVSGFHRNPDNTSVIDNDSIDYNEDDVEMFHEAFEDYAATTPVNFTAVDGRESKSVE